MTGSSDVKIAPEIFAAHAQFGGDLELMQKAYEWHDLKEENRILLAALKGLLALIQSQPRETTAEEIAAEYAIAKASQA